MKNMMAALSVLAFGSFTYAAPGNSTLVCQSQAGAKQKIVLNVSRLDEPDGPPSMSISVDGKQYTTNPPDNGNNYGLSYHDAALGDILVTADYQVDGDSTGLFATVASVPGSVHAYDSKGNPVKWNLNNDGECLDGNGKAVFSGVFTGSLSSGQQYIQLSNQILNCTLTYSTGSGC